MIILGIESSCDETAAAVIETTSLQDPVILRASVLSTSMGLHAQTGGIIPEQAAREQIKCILPVIDQTLQQAKITNPEKEIDAIAITYGPGLIGSLLVGVETAKTLSYLWKKPLIPVNHLYGHLYANWIATVNQPLTPNTMPIFPAIGLIVSGGHTDLVLIKDHGQLEWLGGTRDDAAGEAFDKIGRVLNLPYPAGPVIETVAKDGNAKAFAFPRPMIGSGDFDFSFSGLKTAVLREVQKNPTLTEQTINDICASAQQAIIDVLVKKTLKAAEQYNVKSIVLGGGVAANQTLVTLLKQKTNDQRPETKLFVPTKSLCTDNAAMIASAGFYNYTETSWQELTADPELYFD